MKREYTRNMKCSSPDCKEYAHWRFDTRAYLTDHYKTVKEGDWKCVRHADPNAVLSLSNRKTEWTSLPSAQSHRYPVLNELYWDNHGFVYGDGYKAFASDFPPGTRIRVTAEVLLPEGELT